MMGHEGSKTPELLLEWGCGRNTDVLFGGIEGLAGFLDPTWLKDNEYFMSKALSEAWAGKDSLFHLPPRPLLFFFFFPMSGKSVKTFIRNLYKLAKRCGELICAELIQTNKVTTDLPRALPIRIYRREFR